MVVMPPTFSLALLTIKITHVTPFPFVSHSTVASHQIYNILSYTLSPFFLFSVIDPALC